MRLEELKIGTISAFLSLVVSCVLAYNLLWKQAENQGLWERLDRIEKKIDKKKDNEEDDPAEFKTIFQQI